MNEKTKKTTIYTHYIHRDRPKGENVIKSEMILNAWHNYCMESILFRILVKLGLRK